MEAFWPGGLSLVLPHAPSLTWDLGITRGTVMLRMPLHPVALELLREIGPMAVSSANVSGRPPATDGRARRPTSSASSVAVYLDGGPCRVGVASTIVDLTGDEPRVLREGAVPVAEVAEVLGRDGRHRPDPGSARKTEQVAETVDRVGKNSSCRSTTLCVWPNSSKLTRPNSAVQAWTTRAADGPAGVGRAAPPPRRSRR